MMKLTGKTFLISGVANKKSVAYFTAKVLIDQGSNIIFSAQNETNKSKISKLFPDADVFILDVEKKNEIKALKTNVLKFTNKLDGILHSMAFANFEDGIKPFHETKLQDFLQATHISSFSLVQMTNQLYDLLDTEASIVTIGISNTKATSYGYLGPIKAMLESTVHFLAKSLSETKKIRVNCVGAGPLKTSASAGIPDYIDNYIFSEALTLRKENLHTSEVANTIAFLLSPISSGINAETIIVDAGMCVNHFTQDVVKGYNQSLKDS